MMDRKPERGREDGRGHGLLSTFYYQGLCMRGDSDMLSYGHGVQAVLSLSNTPTDDGRLLPLC